ncbi:MAG: penicillin acylase family protein [Sphingobacteriaceae bacterium]|nr:penicillin acylase family protein [Cytophagaceae bacterium]
MIRVLPLLILLTATRFSIAQLPIDPQRVQIARDRWGVPHIFAPTDPEVAYGLAWAHAEDNFKTIQLVLLPSKGLLGRHLGKQGAAVDYVSQLLHAHELVEAEFDRSLSPDFKALLAGYVQGLNDYARAHPKEVLVKKLFPLTVRDYAATTVLSLSVISGADDVLKGILAGKAPDLDSFKIGGSNAFAIHPSKTTDGQAYLAINSHQPLEGPVAWYEAHLCSEQGWNILGGLFPGGPVVFHGVNEHLGWAHTVNYQDKIDVFQLQMNPANSNQYHFDGQWVDLEKKKVKLRVKGLPVAVGKWAYWSKYGATLKAPNGTFALRLGANMDLRGVEQWYRMNKARGFSEFKKALDMTAIPGFNVVYADRHDTIYYVSNGKIPLRDRAYQWRGSLPGNTSRTLWTQFHPLADLPQLLNPPSGYVFNMNHTPFNATGPADNLDARKFDPTMGYELHNNNRSQRFVEQIRALGKVGYEDFKRIKYDRQLPKKLRYLGYDLDALFTLNAADFSDLKIEIATLTAWDRRGTADSRGAALFLFVYRYWRDKPTNKLTPDNCAEALRAAKTHFQTHFNRPDPTLGEYQKHERGGKELPIWGLPDVLSTIVSKEFKDGKIRATQGESYIELVRFPKNGLPEIETVNCYGASEHPDSPHYSDQMELFVNQQTKKMTLDKATVLREAVRVYHPGEK